MPDPKPNHRRAAAEALMGETGMKYAQLEYPGHLVRWDEDADSVPLTRVMGLRPEQLTRTAQAIADAEERGRSELSDAFHDATRLRSLIQQARIAESDSAAQREAALVVELEKLTDAADELCNWDWTPLVEGSKHGDALVQDAKNLETQILKTREFLTARAALEGKP